MNVANFGDQKTGELVAITTPTGRDYAFVPHPLPPKWQFPIHLYPKLIHANSALAKLDGIGQTLPDQDLLLSPLKRREAITSSRIEGTYATAQELMLFELADHGSQSVDEASQARREVNNYSLALALGIERLNELPFCGRLFKELHGVLMSGVRGQSCTPGQWRDHQVAIGSDRRFVPPPVPQMLEAINDFELYINKDDPAFDALVRAYMAHYQFEAIHPFGDGNGRMGRVILSLMIGRWCNLSTPWLYMSAYFERFKDEYINNLFRVSTGGNWERWIDFCLTGTISQSLDAISRCEKLARLKLDMLQRIRQGKGSRRTDRIVDGLFKTPIVWITTLQRELNVSYPTARADVDRLEKVGILSRLEGVEPIAYYSPEIYNIAYAEAEY